MNDRVPSAIWGWRRPFPDAEFEAYMSGRSYRWALMPREVHPAHEEHADAWLRGWDEMDRILCYGHD